MLRAGIQGLADEGGVARIGASGLIIIHGCDVTLAVEGGVARIGASVCQASVYQHVLVGVAITS